MPAQISSKSSFLSGLGSISCANSRTVGTSIASEINSAKFWVISSRVTKVGDF